MVFVRSSFWSIRSVAKFTFGRSGTSVSFLGLSVLLTYSWLISCNVCVGQLSVIRQEPRVSALFPFLNFASLILLQYSGTLSEVCSTKRLYSGTLSESAPPKSRLLLQKLNSALSFLRTVFVLRAAAKAALGRIYTKITQYNT